MLTTPIQQTHSSCEGPNPKRDDPSVVSSSDSRCISEDLYNGGSDNVAEEKAPVEKEKQFVLISKALVYVVLTLAAMAVAAATFVLTFNREEKTFEKDVRKGTS